MSEDSETPISERVQALADELTTRSESRRDTCLELSVKSVGFVQAPGLKDSAAAVALDRRHQD